MIKYIKIEDENKWTINKNHQLLNTNALSQNNDVAHDSVSTKKDKFARPIGMLHYRGEIITGLFSD